MELTISSSYNNSIVDSLANKPNLESKANKRKGKTAVVAGFLLAAGMVLGACAPQPVKTQASEPVITIPAMTLGNTCTGSKTVMDWDGNTYDVPTSCGDYEIIIADGMVNPLPENALKDVMGSAQITINPINVNEDGVPTAPGSVGPALINPNLLDNCARDVVIQKELTAHAFVLHFLSRIGFPWYFYEEGKGYSPEPFGVADALAVAQVMTWLTPEQRECLKASGYDPANFPVPSTSIEELTADGKWTFDDQCKMYDLVLQFIDNANSETGDYTRASITKLKQASCTEQK